MASHKYQVLEQDALPYARNVGDIVEIDDSLASEPLAKGFIEHVTPAGKLPGSKGVASAPVVKLTKKELQAKAKKLKLTFNTKTTNAQLETMISEAK